MNRVVMALILVTVLLPASSLAAEPLLQISEGIDPHYCISDQDFTISGIRPGQDKESVLRSLGKPNLIEKGLVVSIYHFTGLKVYFCYDSVGIITSTAAYSKTPSGIRPDIHRHDVSRILGVEDLASIPKEKETLKRLLDDKELMISFPSCSDLLKQMKVEFDDSGLVTEVSVGYDCP